MLAFFISIFLMIFLSIGPINVWACSFSSPMSMNIGISLNDQKFFSYGPKNVDETYVYAEVKNCAATASRGKLVMITFGPEIVDILDSYRGINYNKEYSESSSCAFNNNPMEKLTSKEDRQNNFNQRWKFINTCLEINVKEMGAHPLVYPKDQEGCVVTSTSSMSAKFSGGYCFFKPSSDSGYQITVSVSKECLDLNGFRNSQINLQDLNAELSAYTSQNYKDDLVGLTTLGTMPVRVSVNPDKSVLRPSDDFGILRPTFPADYQVNDLHLGKILFSDLNSNEVNINVPFIVDNSTCAKNVVNGVSSSGCDYALPFVGTITLKDNLSKEILTWQDGGIASANWQGILFGEGFRISKELIPTNNKYSFEIVFSDPQFSYNYFKNRISKKIGHLEANFPIFAKDGTISEIKEIKNLDEIDQMIEIEPLGPLNFENPLINLANRRRRLNGYFSTSMFPPMYEKICNSNGKCKEASKILAKFTASFELQSDYSIKNLEIIRTSDLLSSYQKTINLQPEYICQ